jgi:phage tail sheath protein FI
MPEYLSPGVYVEEVDTGSKPIEGVSTSTVGMVGVAEKGPSIGLPRLVTSFADFKRKFGSYLSPSFGEYRFLPYAVEGFFQNGGKRAYIMRVVPSDAVASSKAPASSGVITRLTKDASSGDTDVYLKTLRGIDSNSVLKFEELNDDGSVAHSDTGMNVDSYDNNTKEVALSSGLSNAYTKDNARITVTTLAGGASTSASASLNVSATSKGVWGDDIELSVTFVSRAKTTIDEALSPLTSGRYTLVKAIGFYVGAIVVFDNGSVKQYRKVTNVQGDTITLDSALTGTKAQIEGKDIYTCEFNLTIDYGTQSESFTYLSMNPKTTNYFMKVVNNNSELIELSSPYTGDTVDEITYPHTISDPFDQPTNDDGLSITLSSGSDGTVTGLTVDDYKGKDDGPEQRTGLEAMRDIDQVSILVVPGYTEVDVQNEMLIQCEDLKDRFAILDVPESSRKTSDVSTHRGNFDSKYGAMYHPWVKIYDSLEKRDIYIPPSGHVAGIYARTDIERGVHKAPANAVVRGIKDLKYHLTKGEQDILNPPPNQVNVIRDFRKTGRGLRVWGGRCITSDPDWKYINVRRLFIFVEESIEEGTQWVVFEPNDEPTWARVRRTVSNFLTNIWRDGALQGSKPEEAFFVRCDRTTMTQTDIDNGKLIMEIGIAPVKPAEFVIFRIGQWSGGSEVEEV